MTKFINHSENPNVVFIDNIAITAREIQPGEELTCDYREITTPEHFKKLIG